MNHEPSTSTPGANAALPSPPEGPKPPIIRDYERTKNAAVAPQASGAVPPVLDSPPVTSSPERVEPAKSLVPVGLTYVAKPILIEVSQSAVWEGSSETWSGIAKKVRDFLRADATPPEQIRALSEEIQKMACLRPPRALMFDSARKDISDRFVVALELDLDPGTDLWFIGDLHGDLLSLRTLLHYAKNTSRTGGRRAKFFSLGDLFDDGPYGHRVLFEFLSLVRDEPGTVAFVVGNHDLSLGYDEASQNFTSKVSPCDFGDWLNFQPQNSPWRKLARAAIEFFAAAPRAVLLPGGTLVSHGGVPHTDRRPLLQTASDLNRDECLDDFVWTRAAESAKRKVPNRASHGCQFGILDFQEFCEHAEALLKLPVLGLVRGHDHVPERWQFLERYRPHWLLTINAMSWRQRDAFGPFERKPVIARWVRNGPPEVHRLEIPADIIHFLYDPPPEKHAEGE